MGLQEIGFIVAGIVVVMALMWVANKVRGGTGASSK